MGSVFSFRRGLLLVALCSITASSAFPQQKAVTDAKVLKILELSGAAQTFQDMVNSMVNTMRMMMLRSLPANPRRDEFLNDFFNDFRERANRTAPQVVQQLVPVFERYYSSGQIDQLLRFYESPLGQHMVQVQPQIKREAGTIGQNWGRQIVQRVMADLRPKYPELVRR